MKKMIMNSLGSITELEYDEEMTLRDYFAAKAMQAIIGICYKELDIDKDKEGIVESAYEIADEMVKARND
jgi:hypothetical protein